MVGDDLDPECRLRLAPSRHGSKITKTPRHFLRLQERQSPIRSSILKPFVPSHSIATLEEPWSLMTGKTSCAGLLLMNPLPTIYLKTR